MSLLAQQQEMQQQQFFAAYAAVHPQPPTGSLQLTFKTTGEPKPGDCGGIAEPWKVQFHLSKKSEKGGWVIQHVVMSNHIRDNAGKDPTGLEGDPPIFDPFWEAFKVEPNSDVSEEDSWGFSFGGPGTEGWVKINATAEFYEALILPTTGPDGFTVRHRSPAGEAPYTSTDPKLTGGQGSVKREMKIKWGCTNGRTERSQITRTPD